jgi:predicted adenylyl cyclase CyaB
LCLAAAGRRQFFFPGIIHEIQHRSRLKAKKGYFDFSARLGILVFPCRGKPGRTDSIKEVRESTMGRNIEIKARANNIEEQRLRAREIADSPEELLEQRDTFFAVSKGRLKLRELAPDRGELIHYWRSDQKGPKESNYEIFHTHDPESLRSILIAALGALGEVRKKRYLSLAGQTRIHVDEVEGLGWFLELEVVLAPGQTAAEGEKIAADVMKKMNIKEEDLIECAYIDILRKESGEDGGA